MCTLLSCSTNKSVPQANQDAVFSGRLFHLLLLELLHAGKKHLMSVRAELGPRAELVFLGVPCFVCDHLYLLVCLLVCGVSVCASACLR